MKDIRHWIIVVLSIALWLKSCHECPKITEENETKVTHVTYTDTIPFYKEVLVKVKVPVYTPVYDTIGKTWIYNNPFEDSLLSGNIRTTIQDCAMLGQSFEYKPKFPKYIKITDSIKITNTITKVIDNRLETRSLMAGISLAGSKTSFGFAPMIGLKTKKNDVISVGYDLVNKEFRLSLYRAIKFKNTK